MQGGSVLTLGWGHVGPCFKVLKLRTAALLAFDSRPHSGMNWLRRVHSGIIRQ